MRDAFAQPARPATELASLEAAARSRSEADWIVGMNATRAATIRLRSSFDGAVSLGRVQTPTLAILTRREEEIRAFVPEPYWLVDATFADRRRRASTRAATTPARKPRLQTAAEAAGDRRRRRAASAATITKLEKTKRTREGAAALRPHVAAARRQHALRLHGAAHAGAAQRLYEEHKALTYPRTNSRYLTERHGPRDQADRRPTSASAAEYAKAARVRHRARPAAARPRRRRREGQRPPRDHPDQRRAQASTR